MGFHMNQSPAMRIHAQVILSAAKMLLDSSYLNFVIFTVHKFEFFFQQKITHRNLTPQQKAYPTTFQTELQKVNV